MGTKRHKVFISFQHGCENTEKPCTSTILKDCTGSCKKKICGVACQYFQNCGHYWKHRFENIFDHTFDKIITQSVQDGDIGDGLQTETIRQKIRDNYIADATVTVVLIGPETWKRKHVDWEISSSIRHTVNNPRCGLLGIYLPTHPNFGKRKHDLGIIPERLAMNYDVGYAALHHWSEDPVKVQKWIHNAFLIKDKFLPINTLLMYGRNKANNLTRWK